MSPLRGLPPKIALVEDHDDCRFLMETVLLESSGIHCRVEAFKNGASAIEGIRRDPPDLILLDMVLPDMSGEQVLQQIRSDERLGRIPVIAVTARAMVGDQESFLALGCDGYVSKPVNEAELFRKVAMFLLLGGEQQAASAGEQNYAPD